MTCSSKTSSTRSKDVAFARCSGESPFERIYVVREPGKGGTQFARGVATRLKALDWSGELFLLPFDKAASDPNDLFRLDPKGFAAALRSRIDKAHPVSLPDEAGTRGAQQPDDDRPQIWAENGDLPEVARQAWDALLVANDPPVLFRYGDLISRVEHDTTDAPLLRTVGRDRLHYHVTRAASWYRMGKDEMGQTARLPTRPPADVVRDMLARPDPPLPRLLRITSVPVFAADGRLVEEPGFDQESGTLLVLTAGLKVEKVPASPTDGDLARARALLLDELLGDFPFVGDAERAHAVALLLQPFVRAMISGPTPLHLIEKPTPGTGAGLLSDVLALPFLGGPLPVMTEGRDEDEWRKRITATLIGAPAFVLIDNVRSRLDSAALSAALTAVVWEDRVLGVSQNASIPVQCAWMAAANNPVLSGEVARRTVRIRLDAGVESPWTREGFRHPDLRKWVRNHRAELIWAALTMGRAFVTRGWPRTRVPTIGSYEDWARVLGGILHVAKIPGFLANLEDANADHVAEAELLHAFVQAWWQRYGHTPVRAVELVDLATSAGLELGSRSVPPATVLGTRLRSLKDRRFAHCRLTRATTIRGNQHWRLVDVGGGGGGGGGSPPSGRRDEESLSKPGAKEDPKDLDGDAPPTTPTPAEGPEPPPSTAASGPCGGDTSVRPRADPSALDEELWFRWQERAAIHEFDGGLPRAEAEDRAWREVYPASGSSPPDSPAGHPRPASRDPDPKGKE